MAHFVNYLPDGVQLSIDTFARVRTEFQSLVLLDDDTRFAIIQKLDDLVITSNSNADGLPSTLNQAQLVFKVVNYCQSMIN